jgi:hypothetical protein
MPACNPFPKSTLELAIYHMDAGHPVGAHRVSNGTHLLRPSIQDELLA